MNIFVWFLAALVLIWAVYALVPTVYYKYMRRNSVCSQEKAVMLTFDDGPDPQYTPVLLDLLADQEVKASFFVLTKQAAAYPEIIRRIYKDGHTLAFHGLDHQNLWFASPHYMHRNFSIGPKLLPSEFGEFNYYRPPHGNINFAVLYYIFKHHLKLQLWTVMAADWRAGQTPHTILSRLRRHVRPGSVICLHDGGQYSGGAPGAPGQTIAALAVFIPELRAEGYTFLLPGEVKASVDRGATCRQS